jgi:osmotically-inducible protein OsmY
VECRYQKEGAEEIVRRLRCVKAVNNALWVTPTVQPKEVKRNVEAALKRSAEIDADQINIEIDGGKVTLRGKVRSWAEIGAAEEAAWRAPGVTCVANQLTLDV